MIPTPYLVTDAHYSQTKAYTAGLVVGDEEKILEEISSIQPISGAYAAGEFYKRELAGIKALLRQVDVAKLGCVIVDGYIFPNPETKGLGYYVFEHLQSAVPVIGVAKNYFRDTAATKVYRGESQKPLFVTAVGTEQGDAASFIKNMEGAFRFPDLLKKVDAAARELAAAAEV